MKNAALDISLWLTKWLNGPQKAGSSPTEQAARGRANLLPHRIRLTALAPRGRGEDKVRATFDSLPFVVICNYNVGQRIGPPDDSLSFP
jgi:hypothetical protein